MQSTIDYNATSAARMIDHDTAPAAAMHEPTYALEWRQLVAELQGMLKPGQSVTVARGHDGVLTVTPQGITRVIAGSLQAARKAGLR